MSTFHAFKFVGRDSETQIQVGENRFYILALNKD